MGTSKLWVLAFGLSLSLGVLAQESTRPVAEPTVAQTHRLKTLRLSGKVSDDGTRFVDEASRRVWIVKNIEALKGFENQQVFLRCRVDGDTNLIQVLSIIVQQSHAAHVSDSAFRR